MPNSRISNIYQEVINTTLSRIMMMQNRNPLSSTYGCFDRNYWHFKTLVDFPSATYQQPVLGIARLFSTKTPVNYFYNNTLLAESIRSGILYWCSIQNQDGSVNEYYENDHSFCPTAYTTWAIAQAYHCTRRLFSKKEQRLVETKIAKGGLWLSKHTNKKVYNQMIASMLSLYWSYKVTTRNELKIAFKKRRREVLTAQSSEGWFPENEGADIGYSFKNLDLFSWYLAEIDDEQVSRAVEKLIGFCIDFVHPDGTAGGDYGSRSTQHIFPYGLEFLAKKNVGKAKELLAWFRFWLEAGTVINPNIVDDKYTNYFYFNSYVQAYLTDKVPDKNLGRPTPDKKRGVQFFKDAGIVKITLNKRFLWVGVKRNGVVREFKDDKLCYADTGYVLRLSDGTLCATQVFNHDAQISYQKIANGYQITVRGIAGKIDDSLPLTKWLVPFKLFCKIALRNGFIASWFAQALKDKKIVNHNPAPIRITREILYTFNGLKINDVLETTINSVTIVSAVPLSNVVTTHSLSSRYFLPQLFAQYSLPKLVNSTRRKLVWQK